MPIWFVASRFVLHDDIFAGYADMPVAFMGLCAMYCYWRFEAEQERNHETWFLLGMVCVAGAAEMKQAGLFLAVLLPLVYYYRTKRGDHTYHIPTRLWLLVGALFCVTFVIWYGFVWYRIIFSEMPDGLGHVLEDIHEGRNYFERSVRAWGFWKVPFLLAILSLPAIRHKGLRLPAFSGITFILIWAMFLSYDSRNSILAMILLAPCVAQTALDITKLLRLPFYSNIKSEKETNLLSLRLVIPLKMIALLFLTLIGIGAIFISDERLSTHQYNAEMRIYREDVNMMVKTAMDTYGPGTLLTRVTLLSFLPSPYGDSVINYTTKINDKRYEQLSSVLKKSVPDYILVASTDSQVIHSTVISLTSNNTITFLSEIAASKTWTGLGTIAGFKLYALSTKMRE